MPILSDVYAKIFGGRLPGGTTASNKPQGLNTHGRATEAMQAGDGSLPVLPKSLQFHMVWERKRMPDEGAQSYAWETYGLIPTTPIGPAVAVRERLFNMNQPPMFAFQMGQVQGVPLTAGTIYQQPLYDQNLGEVVVPDIVSTVPGPAAYYNAPHPQPGGPAFSYNQVDPNNMPL